MDEVKGWGREEGKGSYMGKERCRYVEVGKVVMSG